MDQEALCVKPQHKSSFIRRCWWKPHRAMNWAVHSHFILWNELPSLCALKQKSFFPHMCGLIISAYQCILPVRENKASVFYSFCNCVAFEWINRDVGTHGDTSGEVSITSI